MWLSVSVVGSTAGVGAIVTPIVPGAASPRRPRRRCETACGHTQGQRRGQPVATLWVVSQGEKHSFVLYLLYLCLALNVPSVGHTCNMWDVASLTAITHAEDIAIWVLQLLL